MATKSKQSTAQSEGFSLRVTGLLVLLMFVLLAAAATMFFFSQNEERDAKLAEGEALKAELAVLEADSNYLDQLVAMAGQPQYIERIARDELGMVQADEIIFRDID
ncbi:MAG: hypothetical protein GX588_02655 [Clostridiaceae bacterium]|nr:hypothetical protein [Clostridiaceae bacterium]